jgi:curved DNA-binding protein CbpA
MRYEEACHCLGLDTEVELTEADLRRAFKRNALKYHPDKNRDNANEAKELFQQMSQACDFLTKCVARGQTGHNKPRVSADHPMFDDDYYDEDDYEYYDEEEEEEGYVDVEDLFLHYLFARMHGHRGGGRSMPPGGMPGFVFNVGGMPAEFAFAGGRPPPRGFAQHHYPPHQRRHSSYPAARDYYDDDDDEEDDDDDDELDDMFEKMAEQARRKEEQRQKAKKAQEEHSKYMAERARQAELEGRDFFEAWNIKQLKGEAQRRGIFTKSMQQKDIIEVLIADEAKKRLRQQLKAEAPLLDEWAEIIGMKKKEDMNGMKVRVIDFFDGTYIYSMIRIFFGARASFSLTNLNPLLSFSSLSFLF